MIEVEVTITRDGEWWVVDAAPLNAVTQVRDLADLEREARQAIGVHLDLPEDQIAVRVKVPERPPAPPTMVPLAEFLATIGDGDEHGWETEFAWLDEHDPDGIAALAASVREEGIKVPVPVGPDGRIWDGHHRVRVAVLLNLPAIPVEFVPHVYVSTACIHGKHDLCRSVCKYCEDPCRCSCHASTL